MFSPFTTEIGLGDFPIATTVKEEGSKALELRAGQKKKKKEKEKKDAERWPPEAAVVTNVLSRETRITV